MDVRIVFVFVAFTASTSSSTFQTLFPEQTKLYVYTIRTNVSTGTLTPIEDGSYWLLEGTLSVQVYDDFGRARLQLNSLKTLVHTKGSTSSEQSPEALQYLQTPFEVSICFSSIHVYEEPVWVTNIKRALAFNFLINEGKGSMSSIEEPCLYGYCISVYSRVGSRMRKYSGGTTRRRHVSSFERCGPTRIVDWRRDRITDTDPNYLMTAERDYYLDEKMGLQKLELRSEFQYKTHNHILSVTTELSLTYESAEPVESISKLNLTESPIQYTFHNYSNPSNGIWYTTQESLKNKTYETLLKIARKGIDADNIVRNASLIHSLDFIDLLTTMSQLDYHSLTKLFEDVLGTSYDLETARNIFLEVLPYVRTEIGAQFVRHLVVHQKSKIEDSMLLSLIRKLPYTIASHTRQTLEELEVLTKLGLDYAQEIRHASILSFASLVSRVMEANFDQQYFDDIYDKYLRMYNYCPQYIDRLVWLQGLANIGKNNVNYLDEIYTNTNKDRHERLWAALASLNIWKGANLENTLTILMNETEHIQLRAVALHAILSSSLGPRDFFNVHNYIKKCNNNSLKKFWYSTMKSLGNNRFYDKYKSASFYIPFLAAQLNNPGLKEWGTNNYIISQEPTLDIQGPTFQLLTVGGSWSGPPELVMVEFSTGGELAFNGAIYIIAEGVPSNLFRRLQKLNTTEKISEELLKVLENLQVHAVKPEKVHIDIIIRIKDNTVFATHIDQNKFNSWNAEDLRKSIEDFVRFGSHINQQMVYYPVQMLKDFPTEIGTPVRLQSTIVSFTSIRGNLTAPSTDDLTWRNDLHIRSSFNFSRFPSSDPDLVTMGPIGRYQGTSMTSLSTDGPLQPSEHTARIQQSMVVHLPTKFDVRYSPVARSLELTWTNPSQNGGIAMHSRTQVAAIFKNVKEIYTVTTKNVNEKDEGIFFDCENPMTRSQISEHLRSRNNNVLSSLHPARLILNLIRLITSPTSGSCGVILPPVQLPIGHKLQLGIEHNSEGSFVFLLQYFKETEQLREDFFVEVGNLKVEGNDRNEGDLRASLNIKTHVSNTSLNICLKGHHESFPFNIDFTNNPASYQGDFIMYTSDDCKANVTGSLFELKYKNSPMSAKNRKLDVQVDGYPLPPINWNEIYSIFGYSDSIELLNKLTNRYSDKYDNHVSILESDGQIWVNGNKASNLLWLPPSMTPVQILKQFGFYHECRVKTSEVFEQQLVIGDCTENPRFAIIVSNTEGSNLRVYSTKNSASFSWSPNITSSYKLNCSDEKLFKDDLSITNKENEHILQSKLTGILVYHRPNETVVLVPQPYMNTACGSCIIE